MRYFNVLGIYTNDNDPWGGIVDYDGLSDSIDDRRLAGAIDRALANKASDPDIICGSSEILDGYCNETEFETMPFTGTIEEEVLIYVD
ncbi:MAG: hypothetical protein DRQ47_04500 [Gammaproteobacteria bacterium]|nr:MAG: hypothetical protein DRQ47_04500 [Gammaproteobacteria bacterium]